MITIEQTIKNSIFAPVKHATFCSIEDDLVFLVWDETRINSHKATINNVYRPLLKSIFFMTEKAQSYD
jgi:hypothetical protein